MIAITSAVSREVVSSRSDRNPNHQIFFVALIFAFQIQKPRRNVPFTLHWVWSHSWHTQLLSGSVNGGRRITRLTSRGLVVVGGGYIGPRFLHSNKTIPFS